MLLVLYVLYSPFILFTGLIHANHGSNVQSYLVQQLNSVKTEVEKHGGSLGLGLAAMATGDKGINLHH